MLLNEDSDARSLTSDFNPYRYLASEGFLPGYSFPRLPIAAYISVRGRYGADGDYVQRPRFLAIREFGPRSLIYHEGARYEVKRIQIPADSAGEVVTGQARRCASCGHHHDVAPGIDRCEMCGAMLGEATGGLLHLHTVFTRPLQRISSDEEERRRAGFRIVTFYSFQRHGDRPAIEPDGFWLDPVTGRWLAEAQARQDNGDDGEPAAQRTRVIPYVQDRRNILIIQLAQPVDASTALSVMFALERGIEAVFQLEDSELDGELLPPDDGPRDRLLFTESAEGGAGVLRRLHAEPRALARAAREALRIAHFDPETEAAALYVERR